MSESSSSPFVFARKNNKRKRPTPGASWKDLPAFLDASTTVSVGLFGSRRLPELNALYRDIKKKTKQKPTLTTIDALQSGGAKTSTRHLRRRTTAVFKRKYKHRFPNGATTAAASSNSRKARRGRQSTLCQGHMGWQQQQSQPQKGTLDYWMVTHLWHAKRFHMESLWGWKVPLCHSNRGARAALRFNDEGRCSLQDVTWKRQTTTTISSTLSFANLVSMVSRLCPEFAISKAVLCGSQMGYGMIHQLDQFPLQAIGPAQWQVSWCNNDNDGDATTATAAVRPRWVIQWMVHPSIHQSLTDILQSLIDEGDDDTVIRWEMKPAASSCFQLLGKSATEIVQTTLRPTSASTTTTTIDWDWGQVPKEQDASNCLPNGSIFRVHVSLDTTTTSREEMETLMVQSNNDVDDQQQEETRTPNSLQQHIQNVHKSIELHQLETQQPPQQPQQQQQQQGSEASEVLLVWHAPRILDCPANHAVSGWEIYCSSPDLTKAIWNKLVLAGPCCAIGIAEENHLRLDCNPPLLSFPRDYVDTEQGQLYWTGGSSSSWNLVRRVWEGGWGRLPIHRQTLKLPPIQWGSLVSDDSEEEDEPLDSKKDGSTTTATTTKVVVAVARGAFAQPFVDALSGCGQRISLSRNQTGSTRRRRKHRRAGSHNGFAKAPPLSKDQTKMWKEACTVLKSSLSLPAVLICQVQVSGRGTIVTGATVQISSITLGYVTCGAFSLKRGSCHGIVVVGAGRLLEALTTIEGNMGRIFRPPNGSAVEVHLAVTVKSGDAPSCEGIISIIC
eukprot:scaffold449_cov138-Cylindrotheca_fusiformis.AAC.18